jgi:H+/Cl- antiporter ClcA
MCLIVGFIMGSAAFLLDIFAEALVDARWHCAETVARSSGTFLGWLILVLFSVLFMLIASIMTMYVAPSTLGSGVAEAMGLLNGVAYPDFITLKAFIVKLLGVGLAVSAGFAGGKEGPLVHMGAIVG